MGAYDQVNAPTCLNEEVLMPGVKLHPPFRAEHLGSLIRAAYFADDAAIYRQEIKKARPRR